MKHLIITLTLALAAMTAAAQTMPLDSIMAMKPADGSIVNGWLASQTDILAEDWVLVDPNE